jgi:hypothetical protein
MTQKRLLLTLTDEKMRELAQDGARIDIESLIESVPSAVVVSGDRSISVRVDVDSNHADDVVRVVQGFCTVDPYREMKLLGRPSTGRGSRLFRR